MKAFTSIKVVQQTVDLQLSGFFIGEAFYNIKTSIQMPYFFKSIDILIDVFEKEKPKDLLEAPEEFRVAGHDLRPRLHAHDDHRPDHQRHHRIGRNAERQHGDEGSLRPGVVR